MKALSQVMGLTAAALLLAFSMEAAPMALAKEYGPVINMAGRQRMLSQKMAKELFLIKLGVNAERNGIFLKESIALFEKSLDQLIKGDASQGIPAPPNKEVAKQLEKVKSLWAPYKAALETNKIEDVARQNIEILKQANHAVELYEDAAKKEGAQGLGAVVNVAGRQRMLSQKMAKEICLIHLGIDAAENKKNLSASKDLFDRFHKALLEGDSSLGLKPTTGEATLKKMNEVNIAWKELVWLVDKVLGGGTLDKDALAEMGVLNPVLLAQMNDAVKLYEQQGAK